MRVGISVSYTVSPWNLDDEKEERRSRIKNRFCLTGDDRDDISSKWLKLERLMEDWRKSLTNDCSTAVNDQMLSYALIRVMLVKEYGWLFHRWHKHRPRGSTMVNFEEEWPLRFEWGPRSSLEWTCANRDPSVVWFADISLRYPTIINRSNDRWMDVEDLTENFFSTGGVRFIGVGMVEFVRAYVLPHRPLDLKRLQTFCEGFDEKITVYIKISSHRLITSNLRF